MTRMLALVVTCIAIVRCETKTYTSSEIEVRQALHELRAFDPLQLPLLEGFVGADPEQLKHCVRPFYQFQVDLRPEGAQTNVQIKATVTAWCTDPATSASGYRVFTSSGRLEADLLQRLDEHLNNSLEKLRLNCASVEKEIVHVRSELASTEQRRHELEEEIGNLEAFGRTQSAPLKLTFVARPAVIRNGPSGGAVFRAEADDELEVIGERGVWVQVRLGRASSGWIPKSALMAAPDPRPSGPERYIIQREEISEFSGTWNKLRGKKALIVWMRPGNESTDSKSESNKWKYAKQRFTEHYHEVVHYPQSVSGVVLIFDEPDGGVAAASIEDIRGWVDGLLPEKAFTTRCSLDPPEAFRSATQH